MSNLSFISPNEQNSLVVMACLKTGFLKEKQDYSSFMVNPEDCNGDSNTSGKLCGCVLNTRLRKREEKGRCRQRGAGGVLPPRARGSAPSLGLNHNHSLTYRPWLTGGMSLWASKLGQAPSFLEKAEIAVHHKHSSLDHNPDRRPWRCSALGKVECPLQLSCWHH